MEGILTNCKWFKKTGASGVFSSVNRGWLQAQLGLGARMTARGLVPVSQLDLFCADFALGQVGPPECQELQASVSSAAPGEAGASFPF